MRTAIARAFILFSVVVFLAILATLQGVVGFRYPVVEDNEPLENPVRVVGVTGSEVALADGRTLELDSLVEEELSYVEEILEESQYEIELRPLTSSEEPDEFAVFVRRRRWVCGTPYVGYRFHVPLFADRMPRYRLDMAWRGRVRSHPGSTQGE